MLKREVKFVFANPARHQALPGRVLQPRALDEAGAGDRPRATSRCATSSSWSSSASTATSTPTTRTSSTSSTGCGSTRSSSAPPTSTSSRGATSAIVRFRIDGVLHQVYAIPQPVLIAMTSRIKLLARMEIVEKRRPQDGRIKTLAPDGDEVELRISTMPTAFGEKLVMRIFTPEVLVRDFADLGLHAGRPRSLGADDQASRTGSSWSPARPAPARRPRSTRR